MQKHNPTTKKVDNRTLLIGKDFQASVNPAQLAEVVVFEKADFSSSGASMRTNHGWTFPQDSFWNDQISSIAVVSGVWRFCVANDGRKDEGFVDKGVGRYANEGQIGLPNDSISSFYPLRDG